MRRPSTWNVDDGYKKDIKRHESYPYHVFDAGFDYSLFVVLKINNYDIDYLCGGPTQGFRVAFHSPNDTPRGKKRFFNLSPNRAAFYAIEPKYTTTEPKVREFDPYKRRCFFTTERKLYFYRHYSRANCISECLTNFTLSKCGCVHFTMHRMWIFVFNTNWIHWLIDWFYSRCRFKCNQNMWSPQIGMLQKNRKELLQQRRTRQMWLLAVMFNAFL